MNYFFPSLIGSKKELKLYSANLPFSVNSGKNALRLLLRSFQLNEGSVVAIPVFVCDSLIKAVNAEKHIPLLLDLKKDATFWTDYDFDYLQKMDVKVIVLVHLYGFIHPETEKIILFCKEKGIKIIHDAAQSYGVDEKKISEGDGIVYSFGPGKSTTAARGAIVKGLSLNFYNENVEKKISIGHYFDAHFFLESRIFNKKKKYFQKYFQKIIFKMFPLSDKIYGMSHFQKKAANCAINLVEKRNIEREKRYQLMAKSLTQNSLLKIAYDDVKGLYFKVVITVSSEVNKFKHFLFENSIPFFCLYDSLDKKMYKMTTLKYFKKEAPNFIEISCEASIPMAEIERIARLLTQFK
ncbi:MAG TPA: DegT/DnrJ/EryC1/StrS family aminotransferase [Bacteroidia bacterium]|nr:DegT/DnrJ/EryC1/StrS family aminotransferase [Bacteroidia bacterium]